MDINNLLESLNVIIEKFLSSIEGQVFDILDKITLVGPDILKSEPLKYIFFENKINGIIIIANSLVLLYACYYIFNRVLSMYNGTDVESVNNFIFKIVLITLLVNNSYYICEEILNINNIFSECVDTFSKDIVKSEVNFTAFKKEIISLKEAIKGDNLTIDGIIKSMLAFLSMSMLITFSIRYVTIIILIIISPFAFICLLSNATRGISKMWGKLLFINLITQIFIKIILIIPLVYKDKDSQIYKVILLGTMYILYKGNTFIRELTSQISLPKISKG